MTHTITARRIYPRLLAEGKVGKRPYIGNDGHPTKKHTRGRKDPGMGKSEAPLELNLPAPPHLVDISLSIKFALAKFFHQHEHRHQNK